MYTNTKWGHAIIVGSIAGLIGCAGQTSTTAPLAGMQATGDQTLPPPAVTSDRHLQADLDQLSVDTFDSIIGNLPARISKDDAQRLLVQIDPSRITEGNVYSVQARGGHGGGGHGGGGHGSFHGSSFHGHGSFSHGHFNRGFFNSFSYFPYYNYYFPYGLYGDYYYPYAYGGAYPFLYGYNSLLNPYTYGGGTLPWAGMPGMGQGQGATAPTTPAASPTPQPQPPQAPQQGAGGPMGAYGMGM